MPPDAEEEALREAVLRACDDVGLPRAYRAAVLQRLRTPRADWPECCGEGCYPCTQTLSDAAERVEQLLGRAPTHGA